MDGLTISRRLRKEGSCKGIPIIAVTSYAMTGDKEKAIEAGRTGYIEKPRDPETYISKYHH